jgi:hypothetical protein
MSSARKRGMAGTCIVGLACTQARDRKAGADGKGIAGQTLQTSSSQHRSRARPLAVLPFDTIHTQGSSFASASATIDHRCAASPSIAAQCRVDQHDAKVASLADRREGFVDRRCKCAAGDPIRFAGDW